MSMTGINDRHMKYATLACGQAYKKPLQRIEGVLGITEKHDDNLELFLLFFCPFISLFLLFHLIQFRIGEPEIMPDLVLHRVQNDLFDFFVR